MGKFATLIVRGRLVFQGYKEKASLWMLFDSPDSADGRWQAKDTFSEVS